ncbi:endo-1,4-beta-xylanase [Sphingomonas sp. UYAg733]
MLAGIAAIPVAAAPAIAAAGLQEIAGRARMLFGAAVRAEALRSDAAYRAAVAANCGVVTPELGLKWAWVEPERGKLDFRAADQIASFASATGKTMHGHALLWHQSIPGWARQALAEKPDWMIVRRFLSSVMPRYSAVTRTWDVVNEPMDMGHRMDGLRPSLFLQIFGPDYIRRALEDARTIAPNAKLFINEYGLDYDLPWQTDRRYLLLKLLERLKKADVPLDGVGIQAHLDLANQTRFDEKILRDFLNELGGLGLQVRISELDVKEADPTLPIAERDRRVAEAVRAYLDVALDNPAMGSLTCWGLSDRYSWLDAAGGGGVNRGLPLDAEFNPKPLYAVIGTALGRRKLVNA